MIHHMLYDILYALAARDGREAVLFGDCSPLAREAFARSLASDAFPELWFELPLAGDPWFDLHALTAREDLKPGTVFSAATTGGCPQVFSWFADKGRNGRQLALSWDVSSGDIETPAIQLLVSIDDLDTTCGFLEAVGRADAVDAYRVFAERITEGWFACYTGVFPGRRGHNMRVECIPRYELQQAYAGDAGLLEEDLRQVGLDELGTTLVPRCMQFAAMPFQLEFQFDIESDGGVGSTFGASLRFAQPPGEDTWECFDPNGSAGELMRLVEEWGLADDRWRLFTDATFAMGVTHKGEHVTLYCFPAFIKLRWRNGEPLDAKAYFMAGVQS